MPTTERLTEATWYTLRPGDWLEHKSPHHEVRWFILSERKPDDFYEAVSPPGIGNPDWLSRRVGKASFCIYSHTGFDSGWVIVRAD